MRRLFPILAILTLLMAGPATQGRAVPLIADLSDHLVAITTGFSGSELLLFGAIEEPGEVVIVIKGPPTDVAVYEKGQVMGVWMNTARQEMEGVPGFITIASSAPIDDIAGPSLRQRHQLTLQHLVPSLPMIWLDEEEAARWKESFVSAMQSAGLYPTVTEQVTFVGDRLFRATVDFPSNVPTGSYLAQVYYLRDGQMVGAQTTPLFVSRVGAEADIFQFAHEHPVGYGLGALLLALFAGWLAHVAFRRS